MDVTVVLRKTAEKLELERRSKEIATQCLLYARSFYLNWFALTTVRVLQAMNKQVEFQLLVVAATVAPFQELPNLLVYIYMNFFNERRLDPNGNVFVAGSFLTEVANDTGLKQTGTGIIREDYIELMTKRLQFKTNRDMFYPNFLHSKI